MRYRVSPANTHGRTSVLSEDGASQVALAGQRIRTALSASLQKNGAELCLLYTC